jgi:hypothetical protein
MPLQLAHARMHPSPPAGPNPAFPGVRPFSAAAMTKPTESAHFLTPALEQMVSSRSFFDLGNTPSSCASKHPPGLIPHTPYDTFGTMRVAAPRWISLGMAVALMCSNAAAKPSAAKLLDEIILEPGHWSQMCATPSPIPFDVPIPLDSLLAPRFFSISQKNFERLQERRDDVVPEIVRRLGRIDLSQVPNAKAKSFSATESHQDPSQLTGLMLSIILELDAVEALPELLRLENELNSRLEAAALDKRSSLPDLDLDSPILWAAMDQSAPPTLEQLRLFATRIFQRELLSVMATLLRHRQFQPFLRSDFEAKYQAYLKQKAAAGDSGVDRRSHVVPYSQELRLQIRAFVADYLKQPSDKRPAAGSR